MLQLNIQVNMQGAAFEDDPAGELTRILDKIKGTIEESGGGEVYGRGILDTNGNSAGGWSIAEPR